MSGRKSDLNAARTLYHTFLRSYYNGNQYAAQAIKVIMVFYFIAILILVIGLCASIFNTAQNTKQITEQNKQIIKELQMIRLASIETTNVGYQQLENQYADRHLSFEQAYKENYPNGFYNEQQQ